MDDICDVSILVRPEDVPPLDPNHRVIGTLNPGSAIVDGQVRLLLRVIEAHEKNLAYHRHFDDDRPLPDHVYLPRAGTQGINWDKKELGTEVMPNDSYSVKLPGLVEKVRPTVISHARYAALERDANTNHPTLNEVGREGLIPGKGYEEYGIEDPRITALDEPLKVNDERYRYLISYVACSGIWGIATSFAVSNDLKHFTRLPAHEPSTIFHPPQKDVVVFPEKIQGPHGDDPRYWALIRPGAAHRYISPSMFMVASDDLIHWGQPTPVVAGTTEGHVGAGASPVKTDAGWLVIYHGRLQRDDGPQYEGWAALLDKEAPWSSIHRASEPLLRPFDTGDEDVIPDVAFPTGAHVLDDGTLEIYLGVNDAVTAVARSSLADVLSTLE